MKVLVVIDGLGLGGAERLLATFADAAPRADIRLDVVSVAPLAQSRSLLVPVLEAAGVHPTSLGVSRLRETGAPRRLAEEIRRSQCDIVHAHLERSATLAAVAGRLARRPVVSTFHHLPIPLPVRARAHEWLALKAASTAQGVIFVSNASMAGFVEHYRRATRRPASNWTVVHNGIDLREFNPDGPRALLGAPHSRAPVAVVIAALRPWKRIDIAIEAWAQLGHRHRDARLAIVGSGPAEADLRACAHAVGVSERVQFMGMRTDVAAVLRSAALILLPSGPPESLPTVLMEAAACGVPAVAARTAGTPEVVVDGVTGTLVPYGDAAATGAAVAQLLDDPARREQYARRAREHALSSFGADQWVLRLRELYGRAIDAYPRRVRFR